MTIAEIQAMKRVLRQEEEKHKERLRLFYGCLSDADLAPYIYHPFVTITSDSVYVESREDNEEYHFPPEVYDLKQGEWKEWIAKEAERKRKAEEARRTEEEARRAKEQVEWEKHREAMERAEYERLKAKYEVV